MSYQIRVNPKYGTYNNQGKIMYVIPEDDTNEFPKTFEAACDWVKHLKENWNLRENIFIVARYNEEDVYFETEWTAIEDFKKAKKPRIQFSFINQNLPDAEKNLEDKIFYSLKRCKQYIKNLKCPNDYYQIEDMITHEIFSPK